MLQMLPHFKKKIAKNKFFFSLTLILVTINIFLLFFLVRSNGSNSTSNAQEKNEIVQIKATRDPKMQSRLYTRLIERVGPIKAQEDLYHSGLPFDGQTHLLNHTVGDWLYKKYGTEGLIYCRDYLLSSCYHGFVIKAIAEKGKEILPKVMTKCWKEGIDVATQCAHAIGHGFLAWEGYKNLPKALVECDQIALESENFPLYNCHDGVFMENLWAVHEDGRPSPDRWITPKDPLFPCDSPEISPQYHKACWSNQPQVMYQLFSGNIDKIVPYCLSLTDSDLQWTCFDSIARQINPLARGSIDETLRLCGKMPGNWKNECLVSIANSFFSIGDRVLPFEICKRYPKDATPNCYESLLGAINTYANTEKERDELCNKIPVITSRQNCLNT